MILSISKMDSTCNNMPITIDSKKLIDTIALSDDDISNLEEKILTALGSRLFELIVKASPKDEGDYADGWELEKIKDNTITVSNPDLKLFTILEFTGRSPGKIKGKPLLHFVINGKDIFVTFVNHPGFQPSPHVRPALEDLGREAKQIMIDVIKKEFPWFK